MAFELWQGEWTPTSERIQGDRYTAFEKVATFDTFKEAKSDEIERCETSPEDWRPSARRWVEGGRIEGDFPPDVYRTRFIIYQVPE